MKFTLVLALSLLLTSGLALGTPVSLQYQGTLYGPNDQSLPVGLTGTGAWADPDNSNPLTLNWVVSRNPDSSWHYAYTITTPTGGVSHAIIEVSEGLVLSDLMNVTELPILGDYTATSNGNSNPNLPGALHGLKFSSASFSFDSFRAPVWGDFYSKDGNAGGQGVNTIWNSGFGVDASNVAPSNGNYENKILRPDTIPEPATLSMLVLGGLAAFRRRKR